MNPRAQRIATIAGTTLIALAAVATLVLTIAASDKVFAARLIAGLSGCL